MTIALNNFEDIANHVLGTAEYNAPSTWWVAAHYGSPGPDGLLNEWTAIGRKACDSWETSAYGWSWNLDVIEWEDLPTPLAGQETISYYSLWDAESGGNCLRVFVLNTEKVVSIGDNLSIPTEALVVRWYGSSPAVVNFTCEITAETTVTADLVRTAVAAGYSQVEVITTVSLH